MANSEWTQEERDRAIEQLRDNTLVTDIRLGRMIYLAIAIDLQCSLNRLQEEVREAREIIEQYPKAVRGLLSKIPVRNVPHLEAAAEAWLSRNK